MIIILKTLKILTFHLKQGELCDKFKRNYCSDPTCNDLKSLMKNAENRMNNDIAIMRNKIFVFESSGEK